MTESRTRKAVKDRTCGYYFHEEGENELADQTSHPVSPSLLFSITCTFHWIYKRQMNNCFVDLQMYKTFSSLE